MAWLVFKLLIECLSVFSHSIDKRMHLKQFYSPDVSTILIIFAKEKPLQASGDAVWALRSSRVSVSVLAWRLQIMSWAAQLSRPGPPRRMNKARTSNKKKNRINVSNRTESKQTTRGEQKKNTGRKCLIWVSVFYEV